LTLCAAPGARLIRIRCSNQKSSWVLVGYARRSAISWVGPWTLRSGGFVYAPKILPQCNGSRTGASEGFLFFQDKQRISARRRTDRVVRPRHLEMSVGLAPCETIFLSHSSSDSDQFWFARERNPPPDGQYIQAHFRLMLLRERYRRPLTFLASSRQSHDMSASMLVGLFRRSDKRCSSSSPRLSAILIDGLLWIIPCLRIRGEKPPCALSYRRDSPEKRGKRFCAMI